MQELRPWIRPGAVMDHVRDAESDSGLCADVKCPECGGTHVVVLSCIGWFCYSCRDRLIGGYFEDWRQELARLRAPATEPFRGDL